MEIINAIAQVLLVEENQVKSFQEWDQVFFVRFNVGRPTFVSKRKVNRLIPQTWTLSRSKRQSKMWVARITGADPVYRFKREFLEGEVLEWSRKGAERTQFTLTQPGLYQDSEGDYFTVVIKGGAARFDKYISWEEVQYRVKKADFGMFVAIA